MTLTDSLIDAGKHLLVSQIKKRVLGIIFSKLPFLGVPIVGPIVGYFVGKVMVWLWDAGILQARAGHVIIKVDGQVEGYLEDLEKWKKEADPEKKARERSELIQRARDLIKFK